MRKILLCLCGLTPAVITETIYALTQLQRPPFIPDEVHVITTDTGRMLIQEKLLHPSQGRFYALCREYGLGSIGFDEVNVHVINKDGEEILDLKDDLENNITADFILHTVRKFCLDPGTTLHSSLAGGRKTMSFYLGMAMQFYGREQDELSHVLVNPPFEKHPDFFYPPKIPQNYTVYDRQSDKFYTISSQDARIVLARIPFVRLRGCFKNLHDAPVSFSKKVQFVQQAITRHKPMPLLWHPETLDVELGGRKVRLTPVEAAIYTQLLKLKATCEKNRQCEYCHDCYITVYDLSVQEILDFLRVRWGNFSSRLDSLQKRLVSRTDLREWFLQNRSRINSKIRVIDPQENAVIRAVGSYGNREYGIGMEKDRIVLEG